MSDKIHGDPDKIADAIFATFEESQEITKKIGPVFLGHDVKAIAFAIFQIRRTVEEINPGAWETAELAWETILTPWLSSKGAHNENRPC